MLEVVPGIIGDQEATRFEKWAIVKRVKLGRVLWQA